MVLPSAKETLQKMEAVLFDLDGTLLDRATTLERFLAQQYDRFRSQLSGLDRADYVRTVVALDGHGYVPKTVVYGQVREKFGLSPELESELLADFEARFHGMAIPFPGMHEMLQALVAMPLRLGLVTNGAIRSQRPKIEALDIARYFKVILISEEQGARKPEPEIYHRALRALQAAPERAVFVGDHPTADIEGAAKLGLRTIWKRNACWPAPVRCDAVIDSLAEIPPLLARWKTGA